MPTYQYRCTDCGSELEVVQKFTDHALTECPQCEGRLRKVYNAVGVHFKGSGFYATDSRSKNSATTSKSGASGSTGSSGASGSTGSSGSGSSADGSSSSGGSGSGSSGSGSSSSTTSSGSSSSS